MESSSNPPILQSSSHLVGVAIPTLRELRSAVLSSADPAGVDSLREAGYAGGDAVYGAFEQWLAETRGSESADAAGLPLDEFGRTAAEFFRNAGWGEVSFLEEETEGVATVDITGCWEGRADDPGCHVTTGLLASFFGRIAGYPVAVLETECCAGSASRCRFLMGTPEMLQYKWEEMR